MASFNHQYGDLIDLLNQNLIDCYNWGFMVFDSVILKEWQSLTKLGNYPKLKTYLIDAHLQQVPTLDLVLPLI